MDAEKKKTAYFVVGPTAVGKTAYAIKLAQQLQAEIISADSRQFYKEMCIGTAVPSPEELAAVPHHFIQHRSINEDYNVHQFEQEALLKMDKLFKSCQAVVVVGGSGLYLNALAFGIDDLPDPSPQTRQHLNNLQEEEGLNGLRSLLRQLDPVFMEEVDQQNPNRIKRALEVCLTTGKPYSQQRLGEKKQRPFQIKWIGLQQDRAQLYERINQRVDLMISAGLLDEVKSLYALRHLNALNTVGYREFFTWMNGEESYEWALAKVKTNSRRYAKRQMTWFTRNNDIEWIDKTIE
ncbi:MAG: tRNA (adenosine(37)-N6)-dimethylallyltransferase MiaA [Bacteroidetes bacterium 4572_77]|nr:MAG: tRNA (adenosine(37)-N6)-dimethylallyltransferase MiaA [Bacteroidetes bacterium 4572_77]